MAATGDLTLKEQLLLLLGPEVFPLGMRSSELRYIDLFSGIGGFRFATEAALNTLGLTGRCVFSSDIDFHAQQAYEANFAERPRGDIRLVGPAEIPDHELLLAGFPCQPFSIIGKRGGFEDVRGTLFFEIARILEARRPNAFVLENVKQLRGHRHGETLRTILGVLEGLGYRVSWRVLNALYFGLPQKRERVYIVGFREQRLFAWPQGDVPMLPLARMLETDVPDKYYASERIRSSRLASHCPATKPAIWHENKSGHISSYPYACALRAEASYNYLLVDGIRRLTPREMLRLQGFPESFRIVCTDSQTRKQAGNAIAVPVAAAVIGAVLLALQVGTASTTQDSEEMAYVVAARQTQAQDSRQR